MTVQQASGRGLSWPDRSWPGPVVETDGDTRFPSPTDAVSPPTVKPFPCGNRDLAALPVSSDSRMKGPRADYICNETDSRTGPGRRLCDSLGSSDARGSEAEVGHRLHRGPGSLEEDGVAGHRRVDRPTARAARDAEGMGRGPGRPRAVRNPRRVSCPSQTP